MRKFISFLAVLLIASFPILADSPPEVVSLPISAQLDAGIFFEVQPATGLTWASVPLPTSPEMSEEYLICDEGALSIYCSFRLETAHRLNVSIEWVDLLQGANPVGADLFWTTWSGTTFSFDAIGEDIPQEIYQSDWMTGEFSSQLEVKIKQAFHPASLYTGSLLITASDVYIGS